MCAEFTSRPTLTHEIRFCNKTEVMTSRESICIMGFFAQRREKIQSRKNTRIIQHVSW
jgi:hypothetical protein